MQRRTAERAQGRWLEILPALGVDRHLLTNRGTACPVCGGKDRFRFDDKDGKGTWFCNQDHGTSSRNANGSAGTGFALIMDMKRCDFGEAAKLVDGVIGDEYQPSAPKLKTHAEDGPDHAGILSVWRTGTAIAADNPAGIYLQSRIGEPVVSKALRFHTAMPYGTGNTRPGMLSAYVDQYGELAGMQRTFLTPDGKKAPMKHSRLTWGRLPDGGAVRLMRPEPKHTALGIAEGVETALSASVLFGIPCWAALTSGRLEVWEPPEGFRDIIIFGDNDAVKAGQKAAYTLGNRLELRKIRTQVQIPPDIGTDWNDVLMKQRGLIKA